jgi:hypothetical protein
MLEAAGEQGAGSNSCGQSACDAHSRGLCSRARQMHSDVFHRGAQCRCATALVL